MIVDSEMTAAKIYQKVYLKYSECYENNFYSKFQFIIDSIILFNLYTLNSLSFQGSYMNLILKVLILLSTIVLVALVIKFHVHEVQVSFFLG